MSKSEKFVSLLLISILAILLIGIKAISADTANSYGTAEFFNPIHIPKKGLVERWLLDPGMTGDMTSNQGDFEVTTGGSGGCMICFAGFGCDCTSFGGEIASDTTYIYKSSTSAKLSTDGLFTSVLFLFFTFEANKAYQFSFCYKGDDGAEDVGWAAANAVLSDTYNFATDTWTGAVTYGSANNIGTDWTCVSSYILTGVLAKTDYILPVFAASADGDFIYVDNFVLRELDTAGVVGERKNVLSIPVTADPMFGESPELQHKPGSGQVTDRGMMLDGVDDYVDCADGTCDFDIMSACADQGYDFTLFGEVIPSTVTGLDTVIAKSDPTGNNYSYWVYRNSALMYFTVSDDGSSAGGSYSSLAHAGAFAIGAMTRFVVTYDFITDGTSVATIYSFPGGSSTSNTFNGPPYNSTAAFEIGAYDYGASTWQGKFGNAGFVCGAMSAVEVNKTLHPYFPATNNGDGFYVDTCSQAASHSTCTLDKCRDGTPNACQAEGTGVMALFGGYTERIEDNSVEVYTGDDSNPDWTEFTETVIPDGDVATLTAYHVDTKHKQTAMRFTTERISNWPSIVVKSGCLVTGVGTDIYVYMAAKKLSGTARFRVAVERFTDGACSAGAGSVFSVIPFTDIEEGGWKDLEGLMEAGDWSGTENSYKIQLLSSQASPYPRTADFLIDSISVKQASYHTPWFENPSGAVTTTATARDYRLHNPLSDRSDILREDMYKRGFCAWAWVYDDGWAADSAHHYIFYVAGTAGNNNRWQIRKSNANQIMLTLYDGAAGVINTYVSVTTTTWSVGWKYLEACTSNTGTIAGHHYNLNNSTWYDWSSSSGAGTGIQDGQSSELNVGGLTGTSALDGYIPRMGIGPYSAIWPLEGFNSGRPPINGRPY